MVSLGLLALGEPTTAESEPGFPGEDLTGATSKSRDPLLNVLVAMRCEGGECMNGVVGTMAAGCAHAHCAAGTSWPEAVMIIGTGPLAVITITGVPSGVGRNVNDGFRMNLLSLLSQLSFSLSEAGDARGSFCAAGGGGTGLGAGVGAGEVLVY